jgi:acyl-CoA dehydrogenase
MSILNIPEELLALRDSVRSFVEREVRPIDEAHEHDLLETGRIDSAIAIKERRALRQKSVAAGFYAMHMPEEVGGSGVGPLGMALCQEAIASTGSYFAEHGGVLSGTEGPTAMLLDLNEEQRATYLDPLMRAERETCFALTEPEAGSDATAITTRADRDGDGWVINGRKHFITHGQYADFIQLFAVTDSGKGARGGITFFLVDADTPGVEVTRIQHTAGVDLPAELTFTDVRVPDSAVVGEVGYGFRSAMTWINKGRIEISAMAVGKAQYLLDRMVDYAKQRTAFGQAIGSYQAVQRHVVDSLAEVTQARLLVYDAALRVERGDNARQASALAKLVTAEMVGRVADRAIQVYGGNGVMTEMGIERFWRDVRVMRLYEGTTEILQGTVAKTMGLG